MPARDPLFHVVLYQPLIPNNTGAIGRLCVATGCALHLVHPLGFSLDEKARRRAGLDYWPRVTLTEHADWDALAARLDAARLWLFEPRAPRTVYQGRFGRGDWLVFGPETVGLPAEVRQRYAERVVGLPMLAGERSLNLAMAVSAAVYVALGQLVSRGEATCEGATLQPAGAEVAEAGSSRARVGGAPAALTGGCLALAAAAGLIGCTEPLLSPNEPRSQFDRYDRVREQHVEQYVVDEFGRRHPNLRARLLPKQ